MTFAVLYKWLNCAADKTIGAGHTASTDSINYRITLLIVSFISSWCKPLKADPRPIYIYITQTNNASPCPNENLKI